MISTVTRLIDGSKPLARLVEDHLDYRWPTSPMNLFRDRKGRIASFIHGDFHLEFKFFTNSGSRTDDRFGIATCVYNPATRKSSHGGKEDHINKDLFIRKQSEVRKIDPAQRLTMNKDGSIYLFQKVSSATVLIDEELEQTLDNFLGAAESARSTLVHKKEQKRRRLSSWFQRKIK